jgi:hypothetical protein
VIEMQVTISKDDTIILDGAGDKKAIEERAEQVLFVSLVSIDNLESYVLIAIKFCF